MHGDACGMNFNVYHIQFVNLHDGKCFRNRRERHEQGYYKRCLVNLLSNAVVITHREALQIVSN